MVLYPNKLPESERVCSGICSESILEWFKAYYLTGMSRKECLLSIIQIWWHLVVIDRIADLIKCANDEAKSITVVEEQWLLPSFHEW